MFTGWQCKGNCAKFGLLSADSRDLEPDLRVQRPRHPRFFMQTLHEVPFQHPMIAFLLRLSQSAERHILNCLVGRVFHG